jgi:hypothetical protein
MTAPASALSPKAFQNHQDQNPSATSKTDQRTISAAASNLPNQQSPISSRHALSSQINAVKKIQNCAEIITFQGVKSPSPIDLSNFHQENYIPESVEPNNSVIETMYNRLMACHKESEALLRALPIYDQINGDSDRRSISPFQINTINYKTNRIKRILHESKVRHKGWSENQELQFQTIQDGKLLTMTYTQATSLIDALNSLLIDTQEYMKAILTYNQSCEVASPSSPSSSIIIEPAASSKHPLDESDLEKKESVSDEQDLALSSPIQLMEELKPTSDFVKMIIQHRFDCISKINLDELFPRSQAKLAKNEYIKCAKSFKFLLFRKESSTNDAIRDPRGFTFIHKYKSMQLIQDLRNILELLWIFPDEYEEERTYLTAYLEKFEAYTNSYIKLISDAEFPKLQDSIINPYYCTKVPFVMTTYLGNSEAVKLSTAIFPKNPDAEATYQQLEDAFTSARALKEVFTINLGLKSPTDPVLFQFYKNKMEITDIGSSEIDTVNRGLARLKEQLQIVEQNGNLNNWVKVNFQKFYFNIGGTDYSMDYYQAKRLFEQLKEFHEQASSCLESILKVRSPDPLIANGSDLEKINLD